MDSNASRNDSNGKRPPFWANDFLRQLAASHAAQELGPNACWLLTIVAMQQDAPAVRFARPARFWNSQLMAEMGLGEKSLKEARDRAIAAGWLNYRQGNRKLAGQYEVTLPPGFEPVASLPFTVENDGQTDGQPAASQSFTVENDGQTGTLTVENDGQTDGLSTRTLKPNKRGDKSPRVFKKPSVDEVRHYISARGYHVDAEAFIDHYQSNGWKVGRTQMRDWQAAVRTWHRRSRDSNKPTNDKPSELIIDDGRRRGRRGKPNGK